MWRKLFPLLFLALIVAGCTPQQENSAQQQADKAGKQIQTGLDQTGKTLSDDGQALKVKAAMEASDKVTPKDIHVNFKDKVLTLTGSVPEESQKAVAQSIAENTVGHDIKVVNQLTIAKLK